MLSVLFQFIPIFISLDLYITIKFPRLQDCCILGTLIGIKTALLETIKESFKLKLFF